MNLELNINLVQGYKSHSQIARILTENWVLENSYCPACGDLPLSKFNNNRPVADFSCAKCHEEFELKSKNGKLLNKIVDGAYSTMIDRITSENNPNFFFMTYSANWTVHDFLLIPKQFFTPEIIIKRTPLSDTARRAGWVGCSIDISKITEAGKIFLVKNASVANQESVKIKFKQTLFVRKNNKEAKGWILDVMNCLDLIKKENFSLDDVYAFEGMLNTKYPNNRFIKDKIRQQLQVLRDNGIIEFVGRGNYKKINYENIQN